MFEKKIFRSDMIRCALCTDAPCTDACGKLDAAALLRSIWFDNEKGAASRLSAKFPCAACAAPCEAACVRAGEVPIRKLVTRLYDEVRPQLEIKAPESEDRLRTDLCGIPLLFSRQVLQYGATENPCMQWLGKPATELNIAATYNLIYNAALLVRSGVGCAVTLDRLVPTGVKSGLVFRPFVPQLESSLDIVWKKGQFFSPAASAFLGRLQERLGAE